MPNATDAVWIDVLPAMDKFGPTLAKEAGKEADKSGKATGSRFGRAMLAGTAVVGAGAALAAKALYSIGETFDEVSDTIRVGTGATGKDLEGLTTVAKNVGRAVPAEFAKVGAAVADINTRLGLSGKTLETVASQYLEAGRILGEEVDVQKTSAAFNAFKIEGEAVVGAMDHLFQVSQATGVGMNELASGVSRSAPALQTLGFSFEEASAMVGSFDKAGINSQQMMSAMSKGLVTLAKDGEEPAEAFKRVQGEIGDFIAKGDEAGALNLASKVFGTRGATQFVGAIKNGALSLEDMSKVAGQTEDTILGAGAETMDFSEQWQLFKNDVLVGLEPLATRVFGAIGTGMEWIRSTGVPALKDFVGWMKENRTILTIVAGAVGTVVAALLIYNATVKTVTAVTAAWNFIQKVLNGTLKANPIGVVVTVLALLVGAMILAYKKSDTFRAIVDRAWAGIKKAVSTAWHGTIKPALMAMWRFIQNDLMPVVKRLWADVIRPAFSRIGSVIKFMWNGVVKPVFKAWWAYIANVLIPVVKFLWDKVVRPVFTALGTKIKQVWNGVIKPVFTALRDFIRDKLVPGFRRGVDAIGRAWDGLKAAARKPVEFVIDTVYNNGIRKVFNTIAGKLGAEARLPHLSMGGGSGAPKGTTARALGGAGRIPKRAMASAMGGPVDWAKNVVGKGKKWVASKMGGMVDGLIGKVGSSPWAQLAGAAARKAAGLATHWLGDKAGDAKKKSAAGKMGKVGKAGRVLPGGSYRIGMPYLGYPGHYGADYPAGTGTPVFSPWPGRVTATYDLPGSNPYNSTPYRSYGRVVKVTHDNGISTLYAHLSDRIGSTGRIAAGQQIGTVGMNGNATGPHLHFESMRGSGRFNPASLGIFDNGGWLKPGMGGINLSTKPEPVFNAAQWDTLRRAVAQHESAQVRTLAGARSAQARDRGPAVATFAGRDIETLAAAVYEGARDGAAMRESSEFQAARVAGRIGR